MGVAEASERQDGDRARRQPRHRLGTATRRQAEVDRRLDELDCADDPKGTLAIVTAFSRAAARVHRHPPHGPGRIEYEHDLPVRERPN
jgi:hypothetical protein